MGSSMGYLARIGAGVKALGKSKSSGDGDGGSDPNAALRKITSDAAKKVEGIFKKTKKAPSKPYNSSKADNIG